MKFFLISLTIFFSGINAKSQIAKDAVKATINNLFIAMKNGDAAMLTSCFADSAVLQTIIKTEQGKIEVKNENVNEFISFVSHEAKGNADEGNVAFMNSGKNFKIIQSSDIGTVKTFLAANNIPCRPIKETVL